MAFITEGKTNLVYILIIAVLAAIVAGGTWLLLVIEKEVPPAERPKDAISELLENLEKETGMNFSAIQPTEFKWIVKVDPKVEEVAIQGKEFEAKRISAEQYESIGSFFVGIGFEVDLYNIADGTVSELVGYKKDQIVCTVAGGATGYKEAEGQWIPPEPNIKDVEVKCGKGNISIEPIISKEDAIKKLFADKYNKNVSEITISISQETENHIRGMVEFAPGGPGEAGLFLAAKVAGNWQLVFDGIGAIPCEQVEKYNFPEEMVADCTGVRTIETKNGDNFSIDLAANPTTGYEWQVDFDSDYIQLVNEEYTESPHPPEMVGVGGISTFIFKALKAGETEIEFSYLRSWEDKPPIEEKVYTIVIK